MEFIVLSYKDFDEGEAEIAAAAFAVDVGSGEAVLWRLEGGGRERVLGGKKLGEPWTIHGEPVIGGLDLRAARGPLVGRLVDGERGIHNMRTEGGYRLSDDGGGAVLLQRLESEGDEWDAYFLKAHLEWRSVATGPYRCERLLLASAGYFDPAEIVVRPGTLRRPSALAERVEALTAMTEPLR
jgi:hypothetical protein